MILSEFFGTLFAQHLMPGGPWLRSLTMLYILQFFMMRFVLVLGCLFYAGIGAAQIEPIPFRFKPGEIKELADRAITEAHERLRDVTQNTIFPLEETMAALNDYHLHISLLKDVLTDPVLAQEAFDADQIIRKFKIEMMLDPGVFEAFKNTPKSIRPQDQRLIQVWRLKFEKMVIKTNGDTLLAEERALMRSLQFELIELRLKFAFNLNKNSDVVFVSEEELDGLEPKYKAAVQARSKSSAGCYPISVKWNDYVQFMSKSKSEAARKRLYEARCNRAVSNIPILQRGLAVKHQIATLLGYENWVDYKTRGNLIEGSQNIGRVLKQGRAILQAGFDQEQSRLSTLKNGNYSRALRVQPWDELYYIDRMYETVFKIDLEQVREYFPLDAVIDGVFKEFSDRNQVEIVRLKDVVGWHPTVTYYAMFDRDTYASRGIFFIDPYAREGKFPDASAPEVIKGRRLPNGDFVRPMTGMVLNLPEPTDGGLSLINFDEKRTVEHELGHNLQELCPAKTEYASFSGFLTEPDFSEVPSQFNEFILMDDEGLQKTSRHYKTAEPMPAQLRWTLLEAERLQRYSDEMRELFFSKLDFELHTRGADVDVQAVYEEVHQEFYGDPDGVGRNFPASFAYLMDPMYEGHHSLYFISKAIAKLFVETARKKGKGDRAREGLRYRREILEKGGSEPARELIRNYSGQDFSLDAYERDLKRMDPTSASVIAPKNRKVDLTALSPRELKTMSGQLSESAWERMKQMPLEAAVNTAVQERALRERWSDDVMREISTKRILDHIAYSEGKPITIGHLSEGIFRELRRTVRRK